MKRSNEEIEISATNQLILSKVTEHYLQSHDFNGVPLLSLADCVGLSEPEIVPRILNLIVQDRVSIVTEDDFVNPHILCFPPRDAKWQEERLAVCNRTHACVYPTRLHLEQVVDRALYHNRPFTMRMALGEPQFTFCSFDLSVLEAYRNDPRFNYRCSDVSGHISIRDESYLDENFPARDKVHLQSFGFSYDDNWNRAVAVVLRDLVQLSAEHQQVWNAKLLPSGYKIHPVYFKRMILGQFEPGISIFEAFLEQLTEINRICAMTEQPPLFRKVLDQDELGGLTRDTLRHFGFLLRPTQREFHDFVHMLDKLMSDNINREFFDGYSREFYESEAEYKKAGTIQLLDKWVHAVFRPAKQDQLDSIIYSFKRVRELRMKPAHKLNDNTFDQNYFRLQREIIIEAFRAVDGIRQVLAHDPKAVEYKPSRIAQMKEILTY